MKPGFEVFLDTEFFVESLKGKSEVLSKCKKFFDHCYTSVINASEVFSSSTGRSENKVKELFQGIGILGIPFRYSVKIGEVSRVIKKKVPETLLGMQ